jgi:hypothetical protein
VPAQHRVDRGLSLIGCGGIADALLNQLKNRTDTPTAPTDVSVADIKSLAQPTDWTTGQPRDSLAPTEGWQVRVIARLKIVKKEGHETTDIVASAVRDDPDWNRLSANTPAGRQQAAALDRRRLRFTDEDRRRLAVRRGPGGSSHVARDCDDCHS